MLKTGISRRLIPKKAFERGHEKTLWPPCKSNETVCIVTLFSGNFICTKQEWIKVVWGLNWAYHAGALSLLLFSCSAGP